MLAGNDQARGAQQTKVLRDRRTAHTKISRDLADRLLAAAKETQDFPAGRIGYGPEHSVAMLAL